MDFDQLADHIMANAKWYAAKHDVSVDMHFASYNLIKEIGQFADAMLIHQGKVRHDKMLDDDAAKDRLAQELVDIVCLAIINAKLHNIDIKQHIIDKWVRKTGS